MSINYFRSRAHRFDIRQQLINRQSGKARNLFQHHGGCRVDPIDPPRHRGLFHAHLIGKSCLGGSGSLEPSTESFHMFSEHIGMTYRSAIGSPNEEIEHNWAMPRQKERSFLDRALEALRDRYPRERPTQVRLAKVAGVTQPSVHEWGQPDRAPEHSAVLRIARETGVCVEWLYTERGPKYPPSQPEVDPFLREWDQLDDEKKKQITQFSEFLRRNETPGSQ